MCRNYRELSAAEVGEIAQLYPVTPNRVIARRYDISVDALQDYLAYPNGWKKDRKAVLIVNVLSPMPNFAMMSSFFVCW